MGLNDETINDASLSTNDKDLSLVKDASTVVLVADNDPFEKKDLNDEQETLVKNAQVEIAAIRDKTTQLLDLKEFHENLGKEQLIDKRSASYALECFGSSVLGQLSVQHFTMNKSKTNVPYLLRTIKDKVALEQKSLSEQCDLFFSDSLDKLMAVLCSNEKETYINEAISICETAYKEAVSLVQEPEKLTITVRGVEGDMLDISESSIANFKKETYRQTNHGYDLQYLEDICQNIDRIYKSPEIRRFIAVVLGYKPFEKGYLNNPTYDTGISLKFSDVIKLVTSEKTVSLANSIANEFVTAKSTFTNVKGMYESSKKSTVEDLDIFIEDASPMITNQLSNFCASMNLLMQLPFVMASANKLLKEIAS